VFKRRLDGFMPRCNKSKNAKNKEKRKKEVKENEID
jgi:hypothetical protein